MLLLIPFLIIQVVILIVMKFFGVFYSYIIPKLILGSILIKS